MIKIRPKNIEDTLTVGDVITTFDNNQMYIIKKVKSIDKCTNWLVSVKLIEVGLIAFILYEVLKKKKEK